MEERIKEYLKEIVETIESFKPFNDEGIMNDTDGVDRIMFQSNLVRYIKETESNFFVYRNLTEEEIDAAVDFQFMCKNMITSISFSLLQNFYMSTELVELLHKNLYAVYDYSYIMNL